MHTQQPHTLTPSTHTHHQQCMGMSTALATVQKALACIAAHQHKIPWCVFNGAVDLQTTLQWLHAHLSHPTTRRTSTAYHPIPQYRHRSTHSLGDTAVTEVELRSIVRTLTRAWQGPSYDLLKRNCCHFCQEFARVLRYVWVYGCSSA